MEKSMLTESHPEIGDADSLVTEVNEPVPTTARERKKQEKFGRKLLRYKSAHAQMSLYLVDLNGGQFVKSSEYYWFPVLDGQDGRRTLILHGMVMDIMALCERIKEGVSMTRSNVEQVNELAELRRTFERIADVVAPMQDLDEHEDA